MSNLSLLSSNKLPEFIREEYPALVAFVEAYYRYVETLENISDITDIDTAPSKYVAQYKETVTRGFSDPKFIETRRFIQSNKEFFSRKGSPEAFKFFFKAYFGEEIEIVLPNYLIASGGEINTSYFCYITVQSGTLDITDFLEIHETVHDWRLEIGSSVAIDTLVQLSNIVYAVYFHKPRGFKADIGSKVIAKDINGAEKFIGIISGSPYKINAVSGEAGRYWQRGQLITFPPSDPSGTPTIARVKSLNANSGINSIEIIQHGFPHVEGQTVTLSPFPYRPPGDVFYTKVITQFSPLVILHTLDVFDRTVGIGDTITGLKSPNPLGYFLEDYTALGYDGTIVIDQSNTTAVTNTEFRTDYTPAMWAESRSILVMTLGPVAQTIPVYTSEKSLISDQSSKLHDNFYYQAHAYLVKTQQNIGDYRGSIDLIHPAGLKFFAELIKLFDSDAAAAFALSRALSFDKLFPADEVVASELETKHVTKPTTDEVVATELDTKHVTKPMTDEVVSSEVSTLDATKAVDDPAVPSDTSVFDLIKPYLDDAVVITDFSALVATTPITDTVTSSEAPANTVAKPADDTVTAADGTPQAPVYEGYGDPTYHDGTYWEAINTIYIV